MPEAERRRVVSLQKALWSGAGTVVGVVRVALLSDRIDELAHLGMDASGPADAHVVFLCDRYGRLITRLGPDDRFALLDTTGAPDPEGDVRVVPASREIARRARAVSASSVGRATKTIALRQEESISLGVP